MEINHIKNWCSFNMIPYYEIPDESVAKIHELLVYGTLYNPKNDVELLYCATYSLYNLDILNITKYLTESISAGNIRSITMMGIYYYVCEQDMANMWKYLNMGSDKKDPFAITFMGIYYLHTKDYINAEKHFRQAIDLGCNIAVFYLAQIFRSKGNRKQMKKCYILVANRGLTNGMSMMGSYYIKRKKYKKAKAYLQMGIDVEDSVCMYFMGLCCKRQGLYDDMKNYYQQAIDLKYGYAAYKLGRYYRVHEKDYPRMMEYLELGSNLRCFQAMVELGDYYFDLGDYQNIEKYYLMAAKNGSTKVIPKLYTFYLVTGNSNMAKYWLSQMKK